MLGVLTIERDSSTAKHAIPHGLVTLRTGNGYVVMLILEVVQERMRKPHSPLSTPFTV